MKALPGFVLMLLSLAQVTTAAVTLGQLETFSGTHDWVSGGSNPNPPVVIANSGPLGAGDSAFSITAIGGFVPGGRLVVFNQGSWTGDYVGQGISSITTDLRNAGDTALVIRLSFNGPGGWFSTDAVTLDAQSAWSSHMFDVQPGSLTSAGGSNSSMTMAAVSEVRILHAESAAFIGDPVVGNLLVDNIQAVPEPATLNFAALACAWVWLRRKRQTF